jgi:hypothetical protein
MSHLDVLVEVADLQRAADNDKAQVSSAQAHRYMDIMLHFDSEGRRATYNGDGGADVRYVGGFDLHWIVNPLQLHLHSLVFNAHHPKP